MTSQHGRELRIRFPYPRALAGHVGRQVQLYLLTRAQTVTHPAQPQPTDARLYDISGDRDAHVLTSLGSEAQRLRLADRSAGVQLRITESLRDLERVEAQRLIFDIRDL